MAGGTGGIVFMIACSVSPGGGTVLIANIVNTIVSTVVRSTGGSADNVTMMMTMPPVTTHTMTIRLMLAHPRAARFRRLAMILSINNPSAINAHNSFLPLYPRHHCTLSLAYLTWSARSMMIAMMTDDTML